MDDHALTDRGSDPNLILDWPAYINQYDVCITTYNVLRLDTTVARAPLKRPRRQDVEYKNLERPRSPLVVCEWYRVIMDEVQMMGMGKSECVFLAFSASPFSSPAVTTATGPY
jgi:E3 ubiquitin-protein ligase SHPRH